MGLNFMPPPPLFLEVVTLTYCSTHRTLEGYSRGESVPYPHSPTKHHQVSKSKQRLW